MPAAGVIGLGTRTFRKNNEMKGINGMFQE